MCMCVKYIAALRETSHLSVPLPGPLQALVPLSASVPFSSIQFHSVPLSASDPLPLPGPLQALVPVSDSVGAPMYACF